ncbi:restriction endonuclease subunit S [Chryseobacterium sp. GMJ5]|uniref:Restriction endonuclease subunit S n=1 Tax=Chryseobacterium gilvum TaxID=2976534 RepID=A0ABT2VV88_9FLAO|nr:restriction endonuclease subunit S [Chryseobacterium gilvum]MCU7613917.1 restriction endonuclease subunit S [Chryseobacterium gilvum]
MTEKNKSIRNFPNLRFPGFYGEWEMKKIGEVAEIKTGNKDTQNKVENGIYPFFVRSNSVEKINSYSYDGEAILTSGDGVGVGKNFHYINGRFDFHQRVYSIRNFKEGFDGKYIYSIFSEKFYDRVMRLSAKNSVDSVRMSMISEMKLSFPMLSEQQKIASFLSFINERIITQKKIIDNLELLFKGVIYKLFTQKLRLKNEQNLDFSKWKIKLGNEVFKSVTNKNHNSDLPILAITQEYGAIPRDLIDYKVSVTEKSVESYKIVEIGDFIISLRSFQGGIEYSNYEGICSPAYIILKNKIPINSQFYKYFLKSESYIKLLNKKLEGIRDGKMISYAYFSEIELPFPSLEEQNKIANFFSSIEEKIETEKKILAQYETQKKYLLVNLFA